MGHIDSKPDRMYSKLEIPNFSGKTILTEGKVGAVNFNSLSPKV